MTSSPSHGRLCTTIILITALLFLPLTFSANNNNNDALATPIEKDYWYELDRHNYELFLDAYQKCLKSTQEWNEFMAGSSWLDSSEYCGSPPEPPTPSQPLDCSELQTCPTTPPTTPMCGVLVPVNTMLSQYYSDASNYNDNDNQPRIIHVQIRGGGGGQQECKPLVVNGCVWPMVRVGDDCKPAIDCPPGSEISTIDPSKCIKKVTPRWTGPGGRQPEGDAKGLVEHACAALDNIPIIGPNVAKACERRFAR